jgi:hypothetical protein
VKAARAASTEPAPSMVESAVALARQILAGGRPPTSTETALLRDARASAGPDSGAELDAFSERIDHADRSRAQRQIADGMSAGYAAAQSRLDERQRRWQALSPAAQALFLLADNDHTPVNVARACIRVGKLLSDPEWLADRQPPAAFE